MRRHDDYCPRKLAFWSVLMLALAVMGIGSMFGGG